MKDYFYTIEKEIFSEIKIQKSKFIATVIPVPSQLDIPELINSVKKKYYDASHHPYAFRVGLKKDSFRYNDDGEPSGSSGKPILEAIDKYELSNVLCVVTRYFGGILLGIGGLRRAYFDSAENVIKNADILKIFITKKINLNFGYEFISPVMNYLNNKEIKILENNSNELVELLCEVKISEVENLKSDLKEISNGKIIL
ncbi:MAG TPA: YigZ family protein [Ignavibacteria bacterium]|nr:YigZ family protein [Ignavibacteria bacterium]